MLATAANVKPPTIDRINVLLDEVKSFDSFEPSAELRVLAHLVSLSHSGFRASSRSFAAFCSAVS